MIYERGIVCPKTRSLGNKKPPTFKSKVGGKEKSLMHTTPSLEGCVTFMVLVGLLALPFSDRLPVAPVAPQ